MCDTLSSAEVDATDAIDKVVASLAQSTKDEFLALLMGQMIGDAGDQSTKEQMDALKLGLPVLEWYKPDDADLRPLVAAAASLFGMVAGLNTNDEAIVSLCEAVVKGETWAGRIW